MDKETKLGMFMYGTGFFISGIMIKFSPEFANIILLPLGSMTMVGILILELFKKKEERE